MPPAPTLLLTLVLTACAGTAVEAPRVQAAERGQASERTTERAASRIGPPGARGLSLRRVDRPSSTEPPIALY